MGKPNDGSNVLHSVIIDLNGSEARIEKLTPQQNEPEKIRISCWIQDRSHASPLEISEEELVHLLQKAIRAGILTPEFVKNLHADIEI
jgi:hypothetical protein